MAREFLVFPDGFFWGASTSAHQVEGGNFNNWSDWEKKNAERLVREAEDCWQSWQQEKFPEMLNSENYISGIAADHYNRYEEDFELIQRIGLNAYRFSIEWSRIEPEEGKFSNREIEHYRELIKNLRARDIEPFVSLHHFTSPTWFIEKGGWLSKKSSDVFARYVERIVSEFKEDVRFWITINEPIILSFNSYLRGVWPPNQRSVRLARKVTRGLMHAHKASYKAIKSIDKSFQIGIGKNNTVFEAYQGKFLSGIVSAWADYKWNKYFLNKISDQQDFIGINYYFHNRVYVRRVQPEKWFNYNENKEVTDMGWEIYPEGIYRVLRQAARYKKPVYVFENGIADAEDKKRSGFIKSHLIWLYRAIKEGVDVRGYFYWSLLDNFEWDKGFWPRFGLIKVDYKNNLERKVRRSAWDYRDIIERNGLSDD